MPVRHMACLSSPGVQNRVDLIVSKVLPVSDETENRS